MTLLLHLVPAGKVTSYGELSRVLGISPRAVGRLLSKNPQPIIVPCHRVVREGGGLGGYVLGQEMKKKLLSLEGALDGDRVPEERFVRLAQLFSRAPGPQLS
ncbi:MAG: MGMT family protein [Acidilobaceae archaeon]|nr:MGMT family protein [Acidilobaceae archaeon]MCX8165869.1 MGMT family protein [Acidilobaceae archaeon]MDW7974511.1 MGMT family protein [Sulfolobales archaeon]